MLTMFNICQEHINPARKPTRLHHQSDLYKYTYNYITHILYYIRYSADPFRMELKHKTSQKPLLP